jgi:hypothetical protein
MIRFVLSVVLFYLSFSTILSQENTVREPNSNGLSLINEPSSQSKCNLNREISKYIIDTRKSVSNGAKYLKLVKIPTDPNDENVYQANNKCKKICCNTNKCDTAVMSLRQKNVFFFVF